MLIIYMALKYPENFSVGLIPYLSSSREMLKIQWANDQRENTYILQKTHIRL